VAHRFLGPAGSVSVSAGTRRAGQRLDLETPQQEVELNANYIGKIEQGVIRWPNALSREAFRVIFGVSKGSELGFVNARARYYRAVVTLDDVDDVKRRKLFETTLSVGALALEGPMAALLEILEISEPTPIPRRVGASDIEQIRSATQVFESWLEAYGGGVAREAVMGQLRYSAGLLKATCPERLRPELFSAVGDLADVAGWMAVDANTHEASPAFGFALSCAEQATDWNLRAQVLSSMTQQAVRTGQPDDGLTLAELALVRPDRLTATGRAVLHTMRGRALAKMHRVQETLRAIGTADEHFAHSTPANDPPCMAFYTDAQHAQYTGRPLVDLAILGHDPGDAAHRLTSAAAGHSESRRFYRVAFCLAKLASLTMATGDPLEAAAIGHQALDVAGSIRSRQRKRNIASPPPGPGPTNSPPACSPRWPCPHQPHVDQPRPRPRPRKPPRTCGTRHPPGARAGHRA